MIKNEDIELMKDSIFEVIKPYFKYQLENGWSQDYLLKQLDYVLENNFNEEMFDERIENDKEE
jgi:hypothetical protein